jgi:hypothetical protein
MRILGLGMDFSTGKPLVGPMDEMEFSDRVVEALGRNAAEIRDLTRTSGIAATFRGEIERKPTVDLGDPRAAGWTYLVNQSDPQYTAIVDAMRPLAEHRGMEKPEEPLLFDGGPEEEWFDWITENYSPLTLGRVPAYVLIIGGPDQVPFAFQAVFGSAASLGRVAFDSVQELQSYVEKVIRLERAQAPVPTRTAVVFGPDGGWGDATYFSRLYMAEPLAEHITDDRNFRTVKLLGDYATKTEFEEALRESSPALVFTASHGLGAPSKPLDFQKRFNGAICCQNHQGLPITECLFSAEDVPSTPFLEGSVFFQFACFGYGTPAESDYMHWLGQPQLNAEADFIGALPKKLLANPRGPVAYVGHVDMAWLHGFDDPSEPHIVDRWHPRIAPFLSAVDQLLACMPPGLAMRDMTKRYDVGNAQLTTTYDRLQRKKNILTSEFRARLASMFITRSDAQNFFVFGDPAAQLRIRDDEPSSNSTNKPQR